MVSAGQDWSTDDMRASADNWSLANDVNLREYLVNDPSLIVSIQWGFESRTTLVFRSWSATQNTI